ncbi:catalase [Solilutibacter tolerans]|uniref:Catalase n=1 Tax=Solilutibacter tolerans TaxID=1604334 RepID=A0A1N6S463_9GAMM|nr:catalase [Lysobacter tolerans]SIQ35742.1 catalase [Lysobacter tolerans]
MATSRKNSPKDKKSVASAAAARNSESSASKAPPQGSDDLAAEQSAEVEATAAAMPFNENKAAEHGREAALDPPEGTQIVPPSSLVTASTLAESNTSEKLGTRAEEGANPTVGSLDRVRVDSSGQRLTTNQGVPIADNQNSLKAGLRGPALLKDFILREKITHFDHERIPERIVHARGSGAHGFFESYKNQRKLTRAAPFQEAGKITPVFVRFSTVAGERGSKDTARDARGFAVKFYTDEGNWDLVGNNMPVFFIQDAMKFPDLVHAAKPEPHHQMPQAASAHDTFWDFVSLMPESTHMLMWLMSDRAIPRSYRMMQGFGVHTFRFVNERGQSSFVKFHWTPLQGTHALLWDEAVKISGCDPDYHRRDLWEAIEAGAYPEWELGVQIFSEEDAERFSFDILDATKIIPEELVPITPLGRMVLNRNPDNFFAETEQVAFCTAHVVPGIDFTNDPLLAGRIHSYVDTQLSRLGGPNFHEIPINAPIAPVHNNQRDGLHRQAIHRGKVSYEPNSLGGGCPFQAGAAGFVSFPEPVEQDEVRGKPEKFAEHFNQAALFFNSQTPVEQAHIAAAFRFELSKLTVPAIRQRVVSMLRNASEELAAQVAEGLGMPLPDAMPRALPKPPKAEVDVSQPLSMFARPGNTGVATRKVAIFVGDGVDGDQVAKAQQALLDAGAVGRLVGPRVGIFTAADGSEIDADASFENEPSVLFDGVIIPDGEGTAKVWARDGRAAEFVKDQFRHLKTILALGEAVAFVEGAGVLRDEGDPGLLLQSEPEDAAVNQFLEALALHKHFGRETDPPML